MVENRPPAGYAVEVIDKKEKVAKDKDLPAQSPPDFRAVEYAAKGLKVGDSRRLYLITRPDEDVAPCFLDVSLGIYAEVTEALPNQLNEDPRLHSLPDRLKRALVRYSPRLLELNIPDWKARSKKFDLSSV